MYTIVFDISCILNSLAAPKDLLQQPPVPLHIKPLSKLTDSVNKLSSAPDQDTNTWKIILFPIKGGCTPILRWLTWPVSVFINDRMSKCELIELKDLSVNDPIELAAPVPRRATPVYPGQSSPFHVVRLIGDSVSIESPQCHTGEAAVGHDFQPYSHTHLTWCDLCGEFIWGLYKQSLRCTSEQSTFCSLYQFV